MGWFVPVYFPLFLKAHYVKKKSFQERRQNPLTTSVFPPTLSKKGRKRKDNPEEETKSLPEAWTGNTILCLTSGQTREGRSAFKELQQRWPGKDSLFVNPAQQCSFLTHGVCQLIVTSCNQSKRRKIPFNLFLLLHLLFFLFIYFRRRESV